MAVVVASEAIAGTEISPIKNVSAAEVVLDPTLLMKIRRVVATPVVGAVATLINRTLFTKLPLAPEVNTLNISVPTVPPPAELVLAAVVVSVTELTLGVPEKIGDVFATIYLTFDSLFAGSFALIQTPLSRLALLR